MKERDWEQRIRSDEVLDNAFMRSRYNGILRLLDDILSAEDYQGFVRKSASTISSLFGADLVTVYLLSPDRNEFVEQTNAVASFSTASVDFSRLALDVGGISQVFVGRQLLPMNFGQPRAGSEYDEAVDDDYICAMCVPLFIDAEAFGFYSLVYSREVSWTKRDLDYLLAVGHLLGIVFKRVYSANPLSLHAGDLRDCRMLTREIRSELEAILHQTKAEKPDSMPGFSRQEEDCEDKPLTPGDSFRPSYREIQLMAYVAEGYTNKEIAQRLYISERAVKKLFMRLLRRSGLRNRAHVAAYAAHKGYTVD